ncbi:hypothetical protein IE077_003721, partial [Cardiosporidium cionae]
EAGYALGSPSPPNSVAPSIIEFHAFVATASSTISVWDKRLPLPETVECLAVGSNFVAALTSARFLRIYSTAGMLYSLTRLKGYPVALAANLNVLLVISKSNCIWEDKNGMTSDALYFYEFLAIHSPMESPNDRIVVVSSGELSLAASSVLQWVSISDIGMPAVMDTQGHLLGLLPVWNTVDKYAFQWIPLCHLMEISKESDHVFWPLAIEQQGNDYGMILVLRLPFTSMATAEPNCHRLVSQFGYRPERLPLRLPECNLWAFTSWRAALRQNPSFARSPEGVEQLPWEQYDELRHRLDLKCRQLLMASEFGFSHAEDPFKTIAAHEAIIIRMFAKIVDNWKLSNLALEAATSMKVSQTFDNALEKILDSKNHKHKRLIRELQEIKKQMEMDPTATEHTFSDAMDASSPSALRTRNRADPSISSSREERYASLPFKMD